MSYQGHKNYPTWSVALWLSNDEGLYHEARRIVRQARSEYATGDELRDFCRALLPDLGASFASDLLTYAMDEVAWDEVRAQFADEEEDEAASA